MVFDIVLYIALKLLALLVKKWAEMIMHNNLNFLIKQQEKLFQWNDSLEVNSIVSQNMFQNYWHPEEYFK